MQDSGEKEPKKEFEYECSGCGAGYDESRTECSKCGKPIFDCCYLHIEVASHINITKTPDYLKILKHRDQIEKSTELDDKQKKQKLEDIDARLKTLRKVMPKHIPKLYCPTCAKPIEKALA